MDEVQQIKAIAELIDKGELDKALRKAELLHSSTSPDISLRARRLTGLALLYQDEFALAKQHLEIVARQSQLAEDWFQLLIASTRDRDFTLAENALEQALQACESTAAPSPLAMTPSQKAIPISPGWIKYYFVRALCDARAFDRALAPLAELKKAYAAIGSTNVAELQGCGLPAFEELLDATEAVACGLGTVFDYRAWLSDLAPAVDASGKKGIQALLETLEDEMRGSLR